MRFNLDGRAVAEKWAPMKYYRNRSHTLRTELHLRLTPLLDSVLSVVVVVVVVLVVVVVAVVAVVVIVVVVIP